jgi:hypothetical protein
MISGSFIHDVAAKKHRPSLADDVRVSRTLPECLHAYTYIEGNVGIAAAEPRDGHGFLVANPGLWNEGACLVSRRHVQEEPSVCVC